jgi:hypothetical protein
MHIADIRLQASSSVRSNLRPNRHSPVHRNSWTLYSLPTATERAQESKVYFSKTSNEEKKLFKINKNVPLYF